MRSTNCGFAGEKQGFLQKSEGDTYRDFKSGCCVCLTLLYVTFGSRLMIILELTADLLPERDNAYQRCQSVLPRVRGAVFFSVECVFCVLYVRVRVQQLFVLPLSCCYTARSRNENAFHPFLGTLDPDYRSGRSIRSCKALSACTRVLLATLPFFYPGSDCFRIAPHQLMFCSSSRGFTYFRSIATPQPGVSYLPRLACTTAIALVYWQSTGTPFVLPLLCHV